MLLSTPFTLSSPNSHFSEMSVIGQQHLHFPLSLSLYSNILSLPKKRKYFYIIIRFKAKSGERMLKRRVLLVVWIDSVGDARNSGPAQLSTL